MTVSRRQIFAVTAIGLGATTSVEAQQAPVPTPGTGLDRWRPVVKAQIGKLKQDEVTQILQRNGVSDVDELALTLSKRYPTLNPKISPATNPKLLDILKAASSSDGPSYEKGPNHDKEPYLKDPPGGHDRQGFSRT